MKRAIFLVFTILAIILFLAPPVIASCTITKYKNQYISPVRTSDGTVAFTAYGSDRKPHSTSPTYCLNKCKSDSSKYSFTIKIPA